MKQTSSDFKLSKESKRILARHHGESYGHWKGMLIKAEVAEKKAKLAKLTKLSSED